MDVESKNFWKSKTIWLNIVLLAIAMFAPGVNEAVRIVIIASALPNLGLRLKTSQPLTMKKPEKKG